MDYFNYKEDKLYAEEVPIADIVAKYGTPCYIYSRATIERHWHAFDHGLGQHPHKICYSVKANSNLAVLNVMAKLGSGFDIVSVGELERVIAAGGDVSKVVFSGVAKQAHEIRRALSVKIHCFNVESRDELQLIERIASEMCTIAPISIRVNPDVDALTHPYIATGLKENKFGVDVNTAIDLYKQASVSPHMEILGIDCHIGSQLTELAPFLDALDELFKIVDQLKEMGIEIKHLDLGGGLGVRYDQETPPEPAEQASALLNRLASRQHEIILEPGRAITANAGILVSQVQFIKHSIDKNFAIVDAAMNDLIRPALYQAWQNIIPVQRRQQGEMKAYDIVGPICETGDFLGKNRHLVLEAGDLLAVRSAGAYGFIMGSNYNSRPRAAEVMVDGDQYHLVREREKITDLFAAERVLPG